MSPCECVCVSVCVCVCVFYLFASSPNSTGACPRSSTGSARQTACYTTQKHSHSILWPPSLCLCLFLSFGSIRCIFSKRERDRDSLTHSLTHSRTHTRFPTHPPTERRVHTSSTGMRHPWLPSCDPWPRAQTRQWGSGEMVPEYVPLPPLAYSPRPCLLPFFRRARLVPTKGHACGKGTYVITGKRAQG